MNKLYAPTIRGDISAPPDPMLLYYVRTWAIVLAIFLYTQGQGLFSKQDIKTFGDYTSTNEATSALLRILLFGLSVLSIFLIFSRLRQTAKALLAEKPTLIIWLMTVFSTVWSQVPEITLRRSLFLGLAILFGTYLAENFSSATQMRLMLISGVVVALASISMVVLFPQYGLSSAGEWKGIFWHKNRMAQGLLLLFSPLLFLNLKTSRAKFIAGLSGICVSILILLTQSKSILVLSIFLIAFGIFARLVTTSEKRQLPLLFYSAAVGFAAFLGVLLSGLGTTFVLALGKDPTLTGRTRNWEILLSFAFRHLWVGYGYSGFWTGAYGDSGIAISGFGGGLSRADNGYVDFILELGVVGLSMLAILFLRAIVNVIRIFRKDEIPLSAFWYSGILLVTIVGNISETFFFNGSDITTPIFVLACVGLTRLRHSSAPNLGSNTTRVAFATRQVPTDLVQIDSCSGAAEITIQP